MQDDMCGCKYEVWNMQCQGGPIQVMVDDAGCPIQQQFCKVQAGANALAIAAGAPFTITIVVTNFTEAMVSGLVLSAIDPATGVDALAGLDVNSIQIQGTENINGPITGERFRRDATGDRRGTGQSYRGRLGTTGGNLVITGLNRGPVTVDINATIDINAVRS